MTNWFSCIRGCIKESVYIYNIPHVHIYHRYVRLQKPDDLGFMCCHFELLAWSLSWDDVISICIESDPYSLLPASWAAISSLPRSLLVSDSTIWPWISPVLRSSICSVSSAASSMLPGGAFSVADGLSGGNWLANHSRLSSRFSRILWASGWTRSAQVSHRGWTI